MRPAGPSKKIDRVSEVSSGSPTAGEPTAVLIRDGGAGGESVSMAFRVAPGTRDKIEQMYSEFGVSKVVLLKALVDSFEGLSREKQARCMSVALQEWSKEKADRRLQAETAGTNLGRILVESEADAGRR